MKSKIYLSVILLSASLFAWSSTGAETVFVNDPIVITASRYETSVSKEGKDITVITADEIEKSGKKNLSDVLDSVPGVTVTRKGTDVGVSNVYIRGGKSGNVLVMIDGVRISDPMGIEKICDISGIKTYNIERIEIVKGAMSAMYGAEASGGVINIITKKGTGRRVAVTGEAGSGKTFSETVSVSDTTERSSFMFSASHSVSDGESLAKKNGAVSSYDDDGYRNIGASGRIETKLDYGMSLSMSMNYTDSRQQLDDGSYQDDTNRVYTTRLFSSRGEFRHSPFQWWTYKAGVSYMSYLRSDIDPVDSVDTAESNTSMFDGKNVQGDLISIMKFSDINTLTAGIDILDERGESSSAYTYSPSIFEEKSNVTRSLFIHDQVSLFKRVFLNAGGRIDNHEVFGNHFTWDASASVIVPFTETKIRASAGTGFRAPTLYELYDSTNGNEKLKAERSSVYDTGLYQEIFNGALAVDLSLFIQKYRDMIDWVMTDTVMFTGEYRNIGDEITYRGGETSVIFKPAEILTVKYGYTYLKFDRDIKVYKRPAHRHSASVTVTPARNLSVSGSYLYVGGRNDTTYVTEEKLAAYHRFDLNARYSVNDTFTLTLRGENLGDAVYEETYGYNTKRRSFYGGAEIVL